MYCFFDCRFTILPVFLTIPAFLLLGWLISTVLYGQAEKQSVVERLREAEA
jgi:putative ABC transport system permease protein